MFNTNNSFYSHAQYAEKAAYQELVGNAKTSYSTLGTILLSKTNTHFRLASERLVGRTSAKLGRLALTATYIENH